MKKQASNTRLVAVLFIGLSAGGLIFAAQHSKPANEVFHDGSFAYGIASAECAFSYDKKDANADAEQEARKPNPKFRVIFSNGVEAVNYAPGFPSQCSKPNLFQPNGYFAGVDEYIVEPGDGDDRSVMQKACNRAKFEYAFSFNHRLAQRRTALFQSACKHTRDAMAGR